jgi:hypothetical protein
LSTSTPTGGRLALIVIGGMIAVLTTLILCGAIFLHWVNGKRDADGYFSTGNAQIASDTYAVTSDVDVHRGLISVIGKDGFSRVRIRVRSNHSALVFLGVARPHDVSLYLRDTRHTALTDFDLAPFRPHYRTTAGDQAPADPADQAIWTASAVGTEQATLNWDVRSGGWTLVLMNADGSAGVDATVTAGAQVPVIGQAAWIVTAAGLAVLALGGLLIALGLRRRQQPSSPDGSAWAT